MSDAEQQEEPVGEDKPLVPVKGFADKRQVGIRVRLECAYYRRKRVRTFLERCSSQFSMLAVRAMEDKSLFQSRFWIDISGEQVIIQDMLNTIDDFAQGIAKFIVPQENALNFG